MEQMGARKPETWNNSLLRCKRRPEQDARKGVLAEVLVVARVILFYFPDGKKTMKLFYPGLLHEGRHYNAFFVSDQL